MPHCSVAPEQVTLQCIPTVPPREHLPAEPHSATHCCSASPLRSPSEPQTSPSGSETNPPEGHHATHKTICHEIQARSEKYLDGVVVTSPRIKSACLKNTHVLQCKSIAKQENATRHKPNSRSPGLPPRLAGGGGALGPKPLFGQKMTPLFDKKMTPLFDSRECSGIRGPILGHLAGSLYFAVPLWDPIWGPLLDPYFCSSFSAPLKDIVL